jgi:5-methylcytosine-specific restriction endonuclease McrA
MIATRATADHVIPRSQGGKTTVDNLVTACWPCQFGKAEFSPNQLGLEDPRDYV